MSQGDYQEDTFPQEDEQSIMQEFEFNDDQAKDYTEFMEFLTKENK